MSTDRKYIAITGTPEHIAATITEYGQAERLVVDMNGHPLIVALAFNSMTGNQSILVQVRGSE